MVSLTDFFNITQTALTDIGGRYTITDIASGAFSGSITKDGYTAYNFSDTMTPGETIVIDAALSPPPPTISNITVSGITTDSATITWTTDQPSDSLIEYGETQSYGSSVYDPTMTTFHSFTLTNLTPARTYHFRVTSTNSYGLSSSSADNTFTTMSPPPPITLTITYPSDAGTINRPDTGVIGTVTNSTGNETGVTVNGKTAVVYGNQFFVNHLPLEEGQNAITAIAIDTGDNTASTSITVNAVTTTPYITLRANIESGISPLTTYFSIETAIPNAVTNYEMDFEGDGTVDYTGATFQNISFTYTAEGVYYPTVTLTDNQNITYSSTMAIVVLDKTELDILLKARWDGMKGALTQGDIKTALTYISSGSKASYEEMFNVLIDQLPFITATQTEFNLISITDNVAEYELVTLENGTRYSYEVIFIKNTDGIWMIQEF